MKNKVPYVEYKLKFAKNKTLTEAYKMIDSKYPQVLEFGVFQGKTIALLKKIIGDKQEIFGFDSFEGLPEAWPEAEKQVNFSTNKNIPPVEGVKFFIGWFEDTIPQFMPYAKPIALLHVDCDLYSSTKTVLYSLNNYIMPRTIIVFDEWYFNHVDIPENRVHEQKAFFEWVQDMGREYQIFPEIENERRIVKILK